MRTFLVALAFLAFSNFTYAQSKVFIDVGEARVRKSVLAMPDFNYVGANKSSQNIKVTRELFNVIKNDLEVSALFSFMNSKAFLEDSSKLGLRPAPAASNGFSFKNWKSIGAEFLIRGGAQVAGDNIVLEIYAYYVPQGRLVLGKKYQAPRSKMRKLGHTFSDDLVQAVTGKKSFFLHQIVASVDRGPRTSREIYTMDWDGQNPKKISNHKSISISPAWSKNGEHVAYTSFVTRRIGKGPKKKNADIFMYNMKSGKRWLVSYRDGTNSGSEFLPNSEELLVTLSVGRTSDIYRMSLDGKKVTPITRGPGRAMNVEPAVSPNGQKVAFSSDRSGKPMIFTMNMDGSGIKRLTFAGHYNATPSWSPDSQKIAFAGFDKKKGNFDIFVVNADGSGLARLTSAKRRSGKYSNNEEPAFSPDGRHVMFISDRDGNKQLYMVNIDGSNERRITFDDKHYSKPKWGPVMQ